MENASKALLIAAGVLLSVLVISLLLYTAKSFGKIARAEQDAKLVQDKENFNAEYEVYEKNLMYGTDVLSCLNKAQSNNQKYVNYRYFGEDTIEDSRVRNEFLIDVEVKLINDIEEEVKVYKLNSSGKKVQITDKNDINANDIKPFSNSSGFKIPNVVWYYFEDNQVKKGTNYKYTTKVWKKENTSTNTLKDFVDKSIIETNFKAGTYNLFKLDANKTMKEDEIGILAALLTTSNLTEQMIVNSDYGKQSDDGTVSKDWYCATWKTAAYEFKTRKFKCNGIEYNKETGYVSKIKFEEVTNY